MRLLMTQSLVPGMVLAQSIYNEKGIILLSEGSKLSERMIKRLNELDIPYVYVEDLRLKSIQIGSAISPKLRRKAITEIELVFSNIQSKESLKNSFTIEKASIRFSNLIKALTTEIGSNKELLTLISDVYIHDNYILNHSLNVTLYSLAIGIELKLPPKQIHTLGLGAILHDVGKMFVPVAILKKSDVLTEEEFREIQEHSEFGFQLLRNIHSIPLLVAHCAYQHHERLNGSGYPRGLQDGDIHYFAKIIAVADVFDAVTSNRVYRKALLPHEGMEILYSGSGTQFDVKIIEAFRRSVSIYPNGLSIELNDGRKGVVASQNIGVSERPILEIIEENGLVLEETYSLDLKSNHHLIIVSCGML